MACMWEAALLFFSFLFFFFIQPKQRESIIPLHTRSSEGEAEGFTGNPHERQSNWLHVQG